jgi:ABC-type bacteriocin/lantibiotic exporter with double-glycine peptidase domain
LPSDLTDGEWVVLEPFFPPPSHTGRPRLLVLNEGTAHLDAGHEAAINTAIANMGITRLIIARHEETIRIAERVLRL